MGKKIIAMLLAGLLVVGVTAATTAWAANSITTKNLAHVTTIHAENAIEGIVDLSIAVVEDTELARVTLEQLLARTEATADMPLTDFFGEIAKLELILELPEGYDLSQLSMQELVTCSAVNYNPEFGSVTVDISFATVYKPSQTVAVMVGVVKPPEVLAEDGTAPVETLPPATQPPATVDPATGALPADAVAAELDQLEWHALKATVERGGLSITFPMEVLEALAHQKDFLLGVLSSDRNPQSPAPTVR